VADGLMEREELRAKLDALSRQKAVAEEGLNALEERKAYLDAFSVLTVHDEVVIECQEEKAEEVASWLSETLRWAVS
jgi:DNA polymerase I-like protein with 3'-5' exonuclease and polymerase domains